MREYISERGEGCDVIITGLYAKAVNADQVREPVALWVVGTQKQAIFEVSSVVRPARRIE